MSMTANQLIQYLSNSHCPKDAVVRVVDERPVEGITREGSEFFAPSVVWWSDDRETVYLGML